MKLSTKGRYAIMAMMEVALRQQARPVTLADISEEQGISISYLEQLFARLRKNGLVRGTRGPGGGYCLARDVKEISIAEIVSAVEDEPRVKKPLNVELPDSTHQKILEMWDNLSRTIRDFLETLSLGDFIEEKIAETQPPGEQGPMEESRKEEPSKEETGEELKITAHDQRVA
jgi:Rrf2 family iron-sulfur cluster assembly transcriptional regulator